jgi:hypothetical protein
MERVVSFRFRPSCPAERAPVPTEQTKLCCRSALVEKALANAGIEPGFIGRPSRTLVTVWTEVSLVSLDYLYIIYTHFQVFLGWAVVFSKH